MEISVINRLNILYEEAKDKIVLVMDDVLVLDDNIEDFLIDLFISKHKSLEPRSAAVKCGI